MTDKPPGRCRKCGADEHEHRPGCSRTLRRRCGDCGEQPARDQREGIQRYSRCDGCLNALRSARIRRFIPLAETLPDPREEPNR